MAFARVKEKNLADRIFPNGLAELTAITVSWEERRGKKNTLQNIYKLLMGEMLELLVAVDAGKSPEYALIELADVVAFALKYPNFFLQHQGRSIHREVVGTRPAVDRALSQALLAAPTTEVPLQNHGSVDSVLQLAQYLTHVNAAIAGVRVSGPRLRQAISQIMDILGQASSYRDSADGGQEMTKATEKRLIGLLLSCFEQPLNGHMDQASAADSIAEMHIVLEEVGRTMFGYPGVHQLTGSFFYEDNWRQGKNARNYPIQEHQGTDRIRDIRNQFPLSVIPVGFVIGGSESPADYLARRYPGLTRKQIAELVAKEQIIPVEPVSVNGTGRESAGGRTSQMNRIHLR